MKTIGTFAAWRHHARPLIEQLRSIEPLSEVRSAPMFAPHRNITPAFSQRSIGRHRRCVGGLIGGVARIRPGYKRPICKRLAFSQSSRIALHLPELLDVQRASFNKFVRHDIPDLFCKLAPIRVEGDNIAVELHLDGNNFQLIAPDDNPQDCILKLKTYSCKLYIEARVVYKTLANKILYSTKGEWVLIGHLPLMTKRGHFIINGSPRVVVHQVVRSPGIYFQQVLDKDEKHRIRFYGDIIPRRGVWLRLQTTKKGKIEAKLKKGKKVSADMLQRCFQLIERFERERFHAGRLAVTSRTIFTTDSCETSSNVDIYKPQRLSKPLRSVELRQLRKSSTPYGNSSDVTSYGILRNVVKTTQLDRGQTKTPAPYRGGIAASALTQTAVSKGFPSTQSLRGVNNLLGLGKLTPTPISELSAPCYEKIQPTTPLVPATSHNDYLEATAPLRGKGVLKTADDINAFINAPEEKAMLYTYNKLYRPAEDKEREEMSKKGKNSSFSNNNLTDRRYKLKRCYKNLFSTFKEKGRYDLSFLGREKINSKLGIYVTDNQLTALDLYAASSWLYRLTKGEKNIDDIDHFKNRRIRTSGELLYAQFENGVDRLRKYTWNKLKKLVHLQSVQTTFLDLKDSHQASIVATSAKGVHKWGKNNITRSFTRSQQVLSQQEQTATSNQGNTIPAYTVNVIKSYPKTKVLHVSLPPSQTKLRSFFSSESLPKSQSPSELEAATSKLLPNGKNSSKTVISLTENFPAFKNQKADKERYHIRNTRYAGSAPLLELVVKQRHLLHNFDYLARRRWVRRQEKEPFSESHTSRLNSKKSFFVKKLSPAHSDQSDSLSMLQAKLALPPLKEFLSTKPLNGALRELFGSNPLSQYMDQTNPLAEITHKRRMSSLGIGGVSRESAGMAIRGIHPTHYNRICPIETPEGKNAGLVNSLALYARIDNKGFVETPYYKVVKGQVQQELGFTFFSAERESANHLNVAPSDLKQSWSNMLATDSVPVRVADNILDIFKKIDSYQVDCIGLAPVQMISIATSLIPFLEHNDANRALMGSNMQRQAVPLMIPERAIVGTGLESLVVAESGHVLQSEESGFISYVSANRIVVDSLCRATQDSSLQRSAGLRSKCDINDRSVNNVYQCKRPAWERSDITLIQPPSYGSTPLLENPLRGEKRLRFGNASIRKNRLATQATDWFFKEKNLCRILFKNKNISGQAQLTVDGTPYGNNAISVLRNCRGGQACSNNYPLAFRSGWPFKSNNPFPLDRSKGLHPFPLDGSKGLRPKVCYSVSQTAFKQTSVPYNSFLPVKRRYSQGAQLPLNCVRKNVNCDRAKASSIPANASFKSMRYSTTHSKTAQKLTSFVHLVSNFDRSNQETCLTQRALVKEGSWVQKGDILTDCSASDHGELAVGKNILVAYIPWEGYNFEDAIVISERLVKEHVYTSLHIERYDFNAQDFKEGREWFTNDLPGITSTKVKHLDEFGLPKIGSFVKEGDILLGKIRYSNIKATTPYERLLCDILGENNLSARDSSLYVPKGVHARVIKRKILTFSDNPSRSRSKKNKSPKLVHIFLGEKRAIQVGDKMSGRHGNKGVVATILPRQDMPYLTDGTAIDIILNPLGVPSRMNVGQVYESLLGLAGTYLAQHFKIMCFDELYGVEASQSLVYLKLYQARLQSGQNWLFQVDFPGKTRLIDGRSGQCFDQWVTVGKAYMLKLIHMVNEKIHARATGPYALITQQPLRGRSQKGGQRLGEMEVWALEGFGAAYTLQELLTKKSDDMVGRKEVASAILPPPISILDIVEPSKRAQENRFILGQPEIFKVLICELQALCLDVGVYSLTTESLQRSFISKVNSI